MTKEHDFPLLFGGGHEGGRGDYFFCSIILAVDLYRSWRRTLFPGFPVRSPRGGGGGRGEEQWSFLNLGTQLLSLLPLLLFPFAPLPEFLRRRLALPQPGLVPASPHSYVRVNGAHLAARRSCLHARVYHSAPCGMRAVVLKADAVTDPHGRATEELVSPHSKSLAATSRRARFSPARGVGGNDSLSLSLSLPAKAGVYIYRHDLTGSHAINETSS